VAGMRTQAAVGVFGIDVQAIKVLLNDDIMAEKVQSFLW
jgi:hypothetical protein